MYRSSEVNQFQFLYLHLLLHKIKMSIVNRFITEDQVFQMNQMTKEDVRERLGNVDQIRDIIFGAQTRDYDNRFAKMESDISKLQQEIRSSMEQLKTSFSVELKVAVETLDKKLKSLTLNTQEESVDLRLSFDRLNRKFSSSIQTLDEALDTQTNSIREELTESKKLFQEDITTLRNLILEELETRFSDLKENKVSRDDMAETLFALGMKIKGTELIPKLQEAVDEKSEYNSVPLLVSTNSSKVFRHSQES
jgi:F0F1-type ATP synthase membrane subunit b/b'